MRMDNAIITLVGEELAGRGHKYFGTLAAPNGSVYGIPFTARRVGKFNPIDKSMTEIGPDFGEFCSWYKGAMTDNGIIYCPPLSSYRCGILKIDTNTDNATELDVNLLPERGYTMWSSCAAALDGCIYFMPANAHRIMKLDPNNNDAMTSVGHDLGDDEEWKSIGTVAGIDGCVYGIPRKSTLILKYNPINDITTFFGAAAGESFRCEGDGILGRDGCIYAFTKNVAKNGRILKIDTANNSHCFVGNSIKSEQYNTGWSDPILGIDGCIYWPALTNATRRTLKYDPHSNQILILGGNLFGCEFYSSGALATDGVIYCMPASANRVLAIDPLGSFSFATMVNMQEHPEELGCLFRIKVNKRAPNRTYFDCAVTKFGIQIVHEIMQEYMPPAEKLCAVCNLYPFMIAASYNESPLSVIYFLLRQVPFLINSNCNSAV